MPKRRTPPAEGRAALERLLAAGVLAAQPRPDADHSPSLSGDLGVAVRYLLEELAERAPGNAVEVRVPPFGAVQCLPGPRHTRGTPGNVIELPPLVWLALATGQLTWPEAVLRPGAGASGERADLTGLVPLVRDFGVELKHD